MKPVERLENTNAWYRMEVRPRVREFLRNVFDSDYANATSALQSAVESEGFIFLTIHHVAGNQSVRIKIPKDQKATIAHFEQYALPISYNFTLSIRDPRGTELASLDYPRPGGIAEYINRYLDF
jgi:hypothetical protein